MCLKDNQELKNFYYDFQLKLKDRNKIHIYNKFNEEFKNITTSNSYNNSIRIVVETEDAIASLHELSELCGYYKYDVINEIGEWIWVEEISRFVKGE